MAETKVQEQTSQSQEIQSTDSPKMDRVYYNYGDQKIDLKHYIHNLNSNLDRFLESRINWSSAQKQAFVDRFNKLKQGLIDQLNSNGNRFSTDINGITTDSLGELSNNKDILYIDKSGNTYSPDEVGNTKNLAVFDVSKELGNYANKIGGSIAISGYTKSYYDALQEAKVKEALRQKAIAERQSKSSSNSGNEEGDNEFDLNKHNFIAYLKNNTTIYKADTDSFDWDTVYSLDNSEDTTHRAEELAKLLNSYYNEMSKSTLNFGNSTYGSQKKYLEAIKNAANALSNGYSADDNAVFNAAGIDNDFLSNWFNPLNSEGQAALEKRQNESQQLKDKLNVSDVNITNSYNEKAPLVVTPAKFTDSLSPEISVNDAYDQLGKLLGISPADGFNTTATKKWVDDIEFKLINALKRKDTKTAQKIASGLMAITAIQEKYIGEGFFIKDPNSPNIYYLDYRDATPGVAVVWDKNTNRVFLKKLIDLENTPIYNNILNNIQLAQSNRLGGKFLSGGEFAEANKEAINTRLEKTGMTKEQLSHATAKIGWNSVGSNTSQENGQIGADDIARISSVALDLAAIVDPEPVSGAVLNVGSTLTTLGADLTDKSVSGWDAAKNFGINLALDAVGLIPGLDSLKIAKSIQPVAKLVGKAALAYGVLDGVANGKEYLAAIQKVGEGDMSRENVMNAAKLLMLVTSATQYGKGKYRGYKTAKAAKKAGKVGVYVKDKTGKVHELIIYDDGTNDFASRIRENIKNPNRVTQIIKEARRQYNAEFPVALRGEAEFKLDTELTGKGFRFGFKNNAGESTFNPLHTKEKARIFNPATSEEAGITKPRFLQENTHEGAIHIGNRKTTPENPSNSSTDPKNPVNSPTEPEKGKIKSDTELEQEARERVLRDIQRKSREKRASLEQNTGRQQNVKERLETIKNKKSQEELSVQQLEEILEEAEKFHLGDLRKVSRTHKKKLREINNEISELEIKLKTERFKTPDGSQEMDRLQQQLEELNKTRKNYQEAVGKIETMIATKTNKKAAKSKLREARAKYQATAEEEERTQKLLEYLEKKQKKINETDTGLKDLEEKILNGFEIKYRNSSGQETTAIWRTTMKDLDEIKKRLSLIHKMGGSIQFAKKGRELSGIGHKSGTSWENTVGKSTWERILKELENSNGEYYRTINDFQTKHAKIREEARNGGWTSPSSSAYQSNSIGEYQNQYQLGGWNAVAIEPNYSRYDFSVGNGPNNRNSVDRKSTGWKADNLYAGITDDRRLLGRYDASKGDADDYGNGILAQKNEQLKRWNLELFLDKDGYYKMRKIGENSSTQSTGEFGTAPLRDLDTNLPGFENESSSEKGQFGGKSDTPTKTSKEEIKQNLLNSIPALAEFLRMKWANNSNVSLGNAAKKAVIPYHQDPLILHKAVYGDFKTKQQGAQSAADLYRATAAHPLTSNGELQTAAQLEALTRGQSYIEAGNKADDAMYRATQDKAWEREKDNAENSWKVAMANRQQDVAAEIDKASIDHTTKSSNYTNINNWAIQAIKDYKDKLAEKKALLLAANLKDLQTLALVNPQALGIHLSNEEYTILEGVNNGLVLPSNMTEAQKSAYNSAIKKINWAKTSYMRKMEGLPESNFKDLILQGLSDNSYARITPPSDDITLDATNSGNLENSQELEQLVQQILNQRTYPSFKKGGEVKLAIAKIKEKIKNADRLQKVLFKQVDSLDKQLDRISKNMIGHTGKIVNIK